MWRGDYTQKFKIWDGMQIKMTLWNFGNLDIEPLDGGGGLRGR